MMVLVLIIGIIPVQAASKSKKPSKPKISLEVTDATENFVRVVIKIKATKNAEGYELYEMNSNDTDFRNIYTLKQSGSTDREYAIRYSYTCGPKISIKVRAYNGNKYSKFSKVKTINLNKYAPVKNQDEEVTKEGDLLYNSNKIKIYYKGLDKDKVSLEIKNDRSGTVRYWLMGAAVNNCMLRYNATGLSDILSGKKAVESYYIDDTEEYGIKSYETIDVALEFYDPDNGYKTLDTCVVHIRLNKSKKAFVPSLKGDTFIDNNVITASFIADSTDINDMGVLYYNKTNKVVSATLYNVSIDDTMIPATTGFMNVYILIPNCYGYSKIEDKHVLWSSDRSFIEDNKLTKPKKIDGCVGVESRSWETLLTTDEIHIYKKK